MRIPFPLASLAAHVVLACGVASPAGAQGSERSLYWNALEVEARLDAAGRLHVTERQEMVFTGDWNGGERRFRMGPGQKLHLDRVTRIDADGTRRPVTRGNLDAVDHYDWHDGKTLRWRSRRPSDPPFNETPITYVLEYSLSNILIPEGDDDYILDHDFAFPERDGPIEGFVLDLELDPMWEANATTFSPRMEAQRLNPGESFVVRIPLRYRGPGRPAAVIRGARPVLRSGLRFVLLAALGIGLARLVRRERALGRFAPLPAASAIDDTWLAQNLFSMPPEVAGAAADEVTAAPEVAAILARLVGEGKLASEVKTQQRFLFTKDVLYLRLLVDRDRLEGYERALINSLFFDGDTTDTERIRRHYRSRGFDPSEKIRSPLAKKVGAIIGRGGRASGLSWRPIVFALLAGVLVIVIAGVRRPQELGAVFVLAVVGVPLTVFGAVQGYLWRRKAANLFLHALRFLIPVVAIAGITIGLLLHASSRVSSTILVGLTLFGIGLASVVIHTAKSRSGAEGISLRRRLAAARRYFAQELRQKTPKLDNSWFPYLIALGLGPDMDRWFRTFGRAGGTLSGFGGSPSGSSSHSGGGGTGGGWTGGGGTFGGAGASGSWAAAAGSLSAGVPSPSSSSSGGGGGGGGGGSSGGGGGGGW